MAFQKQIDILEMSMNTKQVIICLHRDLHFVLTHWPLGDLGAINEW